MIVFVHRRGDEYTAQVGPPENTRMWSTERPYQRDELRWKIEALGVDPTEVFEAFEIADARAERGTKARSAEEIRAAESMWPRDIPDQQHVARLMADSDLSVGHAKLILDFARGDIDRRRFRTRLFWSHLRDHFLRQPKSPE